jgi:hypothetical protein
MGAAREQGVASPLADAGLTKDEIRALSRARGLPTWSQPSAPCLASRIPYGTAVTPERLRSVERAEHALRAHGIGGDLRVRYHGTVARVELVPHELSSRLDREALARLTTSVLTSGAGFDRVVVDLRGFRSGGLLDVGRTLQPLPDGPEAALLAALEALGVRGTIETVEPVTVVRTTDPAPLQPATARQALLADAERVGVRILAVELSAASW